jgi:hypothetical protein
MESKDTELENQTMDIEHLHKSNEENLKLISQMKESFQIEKASYETRLSDLTLSLKDICNKFDRIKSCKS